MPGSDPVTIFDAVFTLPGGVEPEEARADILAALDKLGVDLVDLEVRGRA